MDWIMPAMSMRIWDQHMTACAAATRNGSPMRLHFCARSERPSVAPEYGCRLYVRVNRDIVGYHDCMGIIRHYDHHSEVPSGWQVLFDPSYHPITPPIPAPAGSACLRQAPDELAAAVCRAGAEGTACGPQSPPAVDCPPSAVTTLTEER